MPNVMAALPNIGGALCSTPRKVWLTPTTRVPCSNATKPVEIRSGAPNSRPEPISAASRPKFNILWGHLEDI